MKFCFLRGPLRLLTAAKNAIVGWVLNFAIRMFVKSAVRKKERKKERKREKGKKTLFTEGRVH